MRRRKRPCLRWWSTSPRPADFWPSGLRSGQAAEDLHQLLLAVAVEAGELEQLAGAFNDRPLFGRTGHRDATPAPELEETLVSQDAQRAQHRVAVDPQHGSEVAGRWEPVAGAGLARRNGPANLGRHLVVQGHPFGPVDLDVQHSASHSSIMP